MELRLEPATRIPRPRWWFVAILLAWVGWVLLFSGSFGNLGGGRGLCHFRAATGVPCPGCGGSTGARAIYDGEPERAFSLNPGLFFFLTLWGVLTLRRMITGTRIAVRFSARGRKVAWAIGLLLFFGSWAYVIWRQGVSW